jgi:hypothetical protein
MSNVIHVEFRPRRPVCPLDEAFARLRRTELARKRAAVVRGRKQLQRVGVV